MYDPGSFTFGEDYTLKIGPKYAVKIGDRAGLAIDFTYAQPGHESNKFVRTALAWQYRNGAWATLVPNYFHGPLPRADAVRIAAGLTITSTKRPLKVPYKLGDLPAGWQAVAVSQTAAATSSEVSDVFLHQGPVANPSTRVDEVLPGNVKITVSKGKPKDPLPEGLTCVAGRQSCSIVRGDYYIGVGSFDSNVPDATIRKIAEGLRFEDLGDEGTWVVPNA